MKWDRQNITFGSLSAAVDIWEQKNATIGVFGRPSGMNLQIVFDTTTGRGTWTLTGLQGQAVGSLLVERSR